MRGRFQARFAGFHAVLGPTLPCPPPPVEQPHSVGMVRALLRSLPMTAFTALANVTGLPAVSLPAGPSREGLPLGVQLPVTGSDEGVLLGQVAGLEELPG